MMMNTRNQLLTSASARASASSPDAHAPAIAAQLAVQHRERRGDDEIVQAGAAIFDMENATADGHEVAIDERRECRRCAAACGPRTRSWPATPEPRRARPGWRNTAGRSARPISSAMRGPSTMRTASQTRIGQQRLVRSWIPARNAISQATLERGQQHQPDQDARAGNGRRRLRAHRADARATPRSRRCSGP